MRTLSPSLPTYGIKTQLFDIPEAKFTEATLELMKKYATEASKDPKIFILSRAIVRDIEPNNKIGQAQVILTWVKQNIQYISDIYGVETIIYPVTLVEKIKSGDCDCLSSLVASMILSVGIPCRFAVVKIETPEWSHVYVEALINNTWKALDASSTESSVGWECAYKEKKTYPIVDAETELSNQVPQAMSGWLEDFEAILVKLQDMVRAGQITIREIPRIPDYIKIGRRFYNARETVVGWAKSPLTWVVLGVIVVGIFAKRKK